MTVGRSFHLGQKSLRGGVIDQPGKFSRTVVNVADVIVKHVLYLITTAWNGLSVGPFEEPAVLVVAFDAKTGKLRAANGEKETLSEINQLPVFRLISSSVCNLSPQKGQKSIA